MNCPRCKSELSASEIEGVAVSRCATCHGDFADNEKLPLYVKNRLTGYSRDIWGKRISGFYWNKKLSDRMKMDDCARCHTEKDQKQNNACFVCHK